MAIANKYDWVTSRDAKPARAVHRRLGRAVVIHEIALNSLDDDQKSAVRSTASNLAKLDHPVLPHLLDFGHDDQAYFMAIESFEQPLQLEAFGFLDELRQLEQICSALAHASDRGVVHGGLARESCCVDAYGHVKLAGLGLKQLSAPIDPLLAESDLQQLLKWIEESITRHGPNAHASREADQLRTLIKAWTEQKSGKTVQAFHPVFRGWLDKEFSRRESDKLSFDGEPNEGGADTKWSMNPIWFAAGAVSLIVIGLVAWLAWPNAEGPEVVAAKMDRKSNAVDVAEASDLAQPAGATDDSIDEPVDRGFVSELGSVGTLNNAGEEAAKEAEKPSPSEDGAGNVLEDNTEDVEAMPAATPEAEQPEEEPESPEEVAEPFVGLPEFVVLPDLESSGSITLIETKLQRDASLQLKLAGGLGAYRTGEFKLASDGAAVWNISFADDTEIPIARLDLLDGKLHFRWTKEAQANEMFAGHLSNVALLLTSGKAKHALALRGYSKLPAIPVQLERKKAYELEFPNPPDPKDVFLEFVADEDSLARALPKSLINASEKMRIGLDAGKESLLVVLVQPKFKGRKQLLSIRASARIDTSSRFVPVKPGATNKLKSDVQAVAQTLFQMKARKGNLKGQAKEQVERRIKQMEVDKKRLEAFVESYLAAGNTKLPFRIYRQVGPYRIPLLLCGLEP